MRNTETNIMNAIMLRLSERGCMVMRNNTGKFRSLTDPSRIVSVGQVGSADVIGVRPLLITADMVGQTIGEAVAIEVKTEKGRQSDAQKKWQAAWQSRGGRYLLARSTDDLDGMYNQNQ